MRRRIVPYLILNVIVSALTALAVLWLWENLRPQPDPVQAVSTSPSAAAGELPAGTPLPTDVKLIEIESIFSVGDLENESVRILRVGQGDLSLQGWQLRDQQEHVYTFPELNFITGAIEVFTNQGQNSVIELHWNLEEPVWQRGETAQIVDPQGVVRASFVIP